MKVYHVEVNINGWRYNSTAGDVECATLDGILAVRRFGCFDDEKNEWEWEMDISMVNVL